MTLCWIILQSNENDPFSFPLTNLFLRIVSFLAFVELDFFLYSITKATFTGLHRMENDITFFDTAKLSTTQIIGGVD